MVYLAGQIAPILPTHQWTTTLIHVNCSGNEASTHCAFQDKSTNTKEASAEDKTKFGLLELGEG